jgi:hypothetical protein
MLSELLAPSKLDRKPTSQLQLQSHWIGNQNQKLTQDANRKKWCYRSKIVVDFDFLSNEIEVEVDL